MKKIITIIFCIVLLGTSVSYGEENKAITVNLTIVNEEGKGIPDSVVESSNNLVIADKNGNANIQLTLGPDTLLVSAKGYLTEIVPVGWDNNNGLIKVKLLSDAKKSRIIMNFGGDMMLGRHYLENHATNTTIGAINVVKDLSRAFSAADLSVVNFESVIGNFTDEQAYVGKKVSIQSPFESVEALKSLGIDLVCLANNHIRDYYDQGVASTLKALSDADIQTVGAGTEKTSRTAAIIEINGIKAGVLAYTTITGSLNDMAYPDNAENMPDNVDNNLKWIWEKRNWGWTGTEWSMPQGDYRIGEIWKAYSDIEPDLSADTKTKIWESLTKTYPEIQDYAASHGHSGAAAWIYEQSTKEIRELKKKADIVIVQLHTGFEYQTAPSYSAMKAAHAAIDYGADIVIAHHPHVLQGMEWYKGHLIAYSMGSLTYDQNVLNVFSSGFLRTVWEKGKLIQARFIPVEISNYKPSIATGITAKQIISQLLENSILSAQTKHNHIIKTNTNKQAESIQTRYEWGTAELTQNVTKGSGIFIINPGETLKLNNDILWPAQSGTNNKFPEGKLLIGRDVFKCGHFDDNLADAILGDVAHFKLDPLKKQYWINGDDTNSTGFLRLKYASQDKFSQRIRPAARIPIISHRLYNKTFMPLDPEASYSAKVTVRGHGNAKARLRMDLYSGTEKIGQSNYDIYLTDNWQTIEIPFKIYNINNKEIDSVLPYFEMYSPSQGEGVLDIDDFEIIEWRDANLMPKIYGSYQYIRNKGTVTEIKLDYYKLCN